MFFLALGEMVGSSIAGRVPAVRIHSQDAASLGRRVLSRQPLVSIISALVMELNTSLLDWRWRWNEWDRDILDLVKDIVDDVPRFFGRDTQAGVFFVRGSR